MRRFTIEFPGPLASLPNPELRIRVVVADPVAMSCRLLSDALQRTKRYEAEPAVTPKEVRAALLASPAHVVIVSLSHPADPMGGFGFVRDLRDSFPEVRVVVLLDALERTPVVEAFRSGANGIFWRADSFQQLCKCIQCVHEGQVWASSKELQYVVEAVAGNRSESQAFATGRPLSRREEEIARLVTEGLSNRQISEQLKLSEHTIKNYLFRIFEKVGVSTRVELALFALRGTAALTAAKQPKLLRNSAHQSS